MKSLQFATALALTAAIGFAPIGLSSASAAPPPPNGKPLPTGTFRIQDNNLNCVDVKQDASDDHLVFIDPCDPLNLDEQLTYNPVTQQILSVTKVGQCLDATAVPSVYYVPCDPNNFSQKFLRTGPDASGRYRIITTTNNKQRTPVYLVGDTGILRASANLSGQPAVDLLFRFPAL